MTSSLLASRRGDGGLVTGAAGTALACGLFLASFDARAQLMPPGPPPAPPPAGAMMAPPVPPSHFAAGSQYYDADVDGLRQYLDGIKATNVELFARLDGRLQDLEGRRTASYWTLGLGLALSVAAVSYGLVGQKSCDGLTGNQVSDCQSDNVRHVLLWSGVGAGTALIGFAGYYIIRPGRSDLLEFVNLHNRLAPTQPLRLELGWDPRFQRAFAGALYRF